MNIHLKASHKAASLYEKANEIGSTRFSFECCGRYWLCEWSGLTWREPVIIDFLSA